MTSNPPASRGLMGRQRASGNAFAWLRAKLCGAQPERTLDAFGLPQDTFGSGALCRLYSVYVCACRAKSLRLRASRPLDTRALHRCALTVNAGRREFSCM